MNITQKLLYTGATPLAAIIYRPWKTSTICKRGRGAGPKGAHPGNLRIVCQAFVHGISWQEYRVDFHLFSDDLSQPVDQAQAPA